jgi:hypothetical protein
VAVILITIERVGPEMVKFGLIVMVIQSGEIGINLWRVAVKDNLSGELAFPIVEIFFLVKFGNGDNLSCDLAGSGRRLWRGLSECGRGGWRGHQYRGPGLLPSHPEVAPGFEVNGGSSHAAELVEGPLRSICEVGRASEARADAIEEAAPLLHDV